MQPPAQPQPQFVSYELPTAITTAFYERVTYLTTLDPAPERMGLDGVSVSATLATDSEMRRFDFWSPAREDQPDHGYLEAVFDVLNRVVTEEAIIAYIEQISLYFDLGLPIKTFEGNPYRIRIYSRLSLNHYDALEAYLGGLPADVPLVVDMSNFASMGTILFPLFQQLIRRNQAIHWIASGRAKSQLRAIGIPERQISE